jgi:hypothetical protein
MMGGIAQNKTALIIVKRPAGKEVHEMAEDNEKHDADARPPLSPAAERALAEAEARRVEADKNAAERAKEIGRKGPDPARYGDWEKNGIASDF